MPRGKNQPTRRATKKPVRGVVAATSVSLVGRGSTGSESLASRVEEAMNSAMEKARRAGERDPKKLLKAKIDARRAVLDDL